ncbi:formate-dependent phosphoribosylglycinamide formyltransferase [SAR202 cluster bacterium AD-802-E10_MRT_200m]|nr:formate-dependent phosphoribosylglycinamide formyltransferase [SAR202 cluster bacterium AD-802-E10_MRT_200m]
MRLPTKILLLGSGELGKELVISAKRLGCHIIACDNYKGAPAQQIADEYETFDMLNARSLKNVIEKHSPAIIIPEIEAIRTEALLEFEERGIQVVPSASAVSYTMNRDRIRDLAALELNLPTARYSYASSHEECTAAASLIGFPLVMKPVMSSSGKGQSLVKRPDEIAHAWQYACMGMRGDRPQVIMEEFINFEYEITLLTVRQKNGDTLFCEPIGHRQERGDYQESWQPIAMNPVFLDQAHNIARTISTRLGGAGIYGVELFITTDNVIFSEISPRPHDTGMVTLISQNLSEFDLHVRAILGLPIPQIEVYGPSASAVVLAEKEASHVTYKGLNEALSTSGVDIRIFGKHETRKFRRMAVCLAKGDTIEDAREKAATASKAITLHYFS